MKTIIPKDCFLCDHCNNALSDDKFIALEDCVILGEEICAKRCEIYEKYQAEEIDEQGLQECRDTHEQEIVCEETYCNKCQVKWKAHIEKYNLVTTMEITKGQDCSKTVLANPIVIFGGNIQ